MMSILIEQLINITDAIFLGHVGEIELGASHFSETGKTFFQGLFFLSGLAVFLCLLSKLFSPIILSRLITSVEVYHAVIDYLDGRIWGLLFSFPFLALRSFLVGITQTKALNMAAFTAVLVNIPMNWFLIFGFNMGISGAAIASSFAEACSLAVLAIYVLRKMDKRLYGLHCRLDKSVLLHVCRVSVWSMFHSFIGVASWLAFFVSIEHLGEIELAATNVIRSVSTLFFVIVNSLAATTGSLVSNLLGAGQKKQVVPLCNRVVRSDYQYLYGKPGSDADSPSALCSHAAELCFCPARLCLYECSNRYGSYTYDIYFPIDNHRSLSDLFVEHKRFQHIIVRLLDGRIPICDITRFVICHLSEI